MTNAEKKRILNSYRRLVQQEKAIIEELDELTLLRSPALDSMPRTQEAHDLADVIAQNEKLFSRWSAILKKKYAAMDLITDAIEAMPNEAEKTLLVLRYIGGKTFEEVAEEMNYSWRHVLNIHGYALAHFMENQ